MINFQLPDRDSACTQEDVLCCSTFLKFLSVSRRNVLQSIVCAAEELSLSPELTARTLVEMGLRADADCFPPAFVRRIYDRKDVPRWSVAALSKAQYALFLMWPCSDIVASSGAKYRHLTLVHAA